VHAGSTDAALVDEALQALLDRYRAAEIDASYAAYDTQPADHPDEWGDLASWRQPAGASCFTAREQVATCPVVDRNQIGRRASASIGAS
jgi:hypothetical protein